MERILLHIVQGVTVVGIVGGYVSMAELKTSNAVLQIELRALTDRLDDFRALSGDRYTSTQAQRDIKPIIDRMSDHEARLRQLERHSIK
ncbi:hypothetical protein [Sulfitobacter sp.]|uniref:hypothetical protein n=1 Tax=Sulfitobacter sp. TaxID=1903071 RepID=UPI0030032704